MREAFWTFAALLSHWRRHRANVATVMVGLAVATALWSGVQALNSQARQSYDQAARLVGEAGAPAIVSAQGAFVRQDHYVALRRAGFKVSPVLEGAVRIGGAAY
ncbi:MAG TPA: ABC transporter permease, partial [Hyphomicrobium sp.]|nr:ABC transporter permease [Hyphomicrobium sp.]